MISLHSAPEKRLPRIPRGDESSVFEFFKGAPYVFLHRSDRHGHLNESECPDELPERAEPFYVTSARLPKSAFTLRSAFDGLTGANKPRVDTVSWVAFPKTAGMGVNDRTIDAQRFLLQDEYVEWRVEKSGTKVTRITFCTEFPEFYQAMAEVSMAALIRGIKAVIPGANPTSAELFGPGFNANTATPDQRAGRFAARIPTNPWNTGKKGILCLGQGANTMGALFNLVARCAVPRPDLDPGDVCDQAGGGACGSGRNSDPVVSLAVQNLSLVPRALSLQDAVGIRIISMNGIWKIGTQQIDINDPARNRGAWVVSRNGRRAVLDVTTGVTFGDSPIVTGTQVARALVVGVDVISAPEDAIPDFARAGNESRIPS